MDQELTLFHAQVNRYSCMLQLCVHKGPANDHYDNNYVYTVHCYDYELSYNNYVIIV